MFWGQSWSQLNCSLGLVKVHLNQDLGSAMIWIHCCFGSLVVFAQSWFWFICGLGSIASSYRSCFFVNQQQYETAIFISYVKKPMHILQAAWYRMGLSKWFVSYVCIWCFVHEKLWLFHYLWMSRLWWRTTIVKLVSFLIVILFYSWDTLETMITHEKSTYMFVYVFRDCSSQAFHLYTFDFN